MATDRQIARERNAWIEAREAAKRERAQPKEPDPPRAPEPTVEQDALFS